MDTKISNSITGSNHNPIENVINSQGRTFLAVNVTKQ